MPKRCCFYAFHFSAGAQLCHTASKYFSGGQGLIRQIFFTGDCPFTGAFVKSFCPAGDSFISGHTSFAMWLFALALVMPQRIRIPSLTAAVGIVLTIAASRILGGYHFLTDVYFAMLLTGCGIWATYETMFIAENCTNQPEIGTPVSHTTTRLYEHKL